MDTQTSKVHYSLLSAEIVVGQLTCEVPERRKVKELLITGSHGFIGSSFKEHFREHRHSFNIREGDREGNCNKRVDIVLDFAAYGNMYGQNEPDLIYQSNVTRLLNLLKNTDKYKYRAFIVTGSSSEYGKRLIPMNEYMVPKPETFYAASKVAAAMLGLAWAKERDKPVVVVRPFTVTGVGDQEKHLIPTLIRSCIEGEKMKFVANPMHDFVDIRDFISGVLTIIRYIDKSKGQIFNIGSGQQHSNQEVREIVEKVTGKKANVELVPELRTYDTPMWEADIFKLKSLGWKPEISLEETITDMVKNYYEFKRKIA